MLEKYEDLKLNRCTLKKIDIYLTICVYTSKLCVISDDYCHNIISNIYYTIIIKVVYYVLFHYEINIII